MIESAFNWLSKYREICDKPWLILGKGPTFSWRRQYNLEEFNLLSLNHVIEEQCVLLAHIIDIEVVEHCGEKLLENAQMVVMPWIPHVRKHEGILRRHVRFGPGSRDLEGYCDDFPTLRRLEHEGRLLGYNLSSAPTERRRSGPVVNAHSFSAEAALNLLASVGCKTVRSLGVDGGRRYDNTFTSWAASTLLAANQNSFDLQFKQIARTIMQTDVDFAPLGYESPIHVFVGAEPEQELPTKVLEYSIRKNCSMSVEVKPLYVAIQKKGIGMPAMRTAAGGMRTPFSFQRFAIPQLKDWKGRAIYLDSDMQVFGDLRKLWTYPMNGAQIIAAKEPENSSRRSQFSVMVMDCEELSWSLEQLARSLDEGAYTYEELVYKMRAADRVSQSLPHTWNDLERYTPGQTNLIHYTDMAYQPWLSTENPLARIWCAELLEAVEHGYISRDEVMSYVERGLVRPSLLYQLDNKLDDPRLLPLNVLRADHTRFVPPHNVKRQLHGITGYNRRPNLLQYVGRRVYATVFYVIRTSRLRKVARKLRNRLARL